MSQLIQVNPQNQDFVKGLVLTRVYTRDGKQFIRIGNCSLDFKGEFEFLGFTKKFNKLKLTKTNQSSNTFFAAINLEEFNHIDGRVFWIVKITTLGCRYIETLKEIEL